MSNRTAPPDKLRRDGTPVALRQVSLDGARLLLTPEEVAQVLAIGRSKVYDLLRSEEMSSVRIGGSPRSPPSTNLSIGFALSRAPSGNDPHG
jgi:excisionase family DNA binding protein